jgi:dolichyl-phosphate beta-glucosyltransferase
MKNSLTLSLVIPVFNEEHRIAAGLTQALHYLHKQTYGWEIIIVDDGSTDKTMLQAKRLLKEVTHKQLIAHPFNQGKGAAIRTGMLAARGEFVIFSDIDFSTPIETVETLLKALKTADVAIGVRRHPKSLVTVHQPPVREFLGQCFTKLTNLVATPGIYDVTCGFKGFTQSAAQKLFTKMRVSEWAFDAELLFLARKYGFTISQVPVTWANNPATKVNMLRDGLVTLKDLARIRIGDFLGVYN